MVENKISFRCPGCESLIGFPGTEAGTVQDCPECGGWVDVPEVVRQPQNDYPSFGEAQRENHQNANLLAENARQLAEGARLLVESGKTHAEWERQLKQAARFQDQAGEIFARLTILVTRWEALTNALEKKF